MDSNPSEKRLKTEAIDRISDLHDSILGKILSFLPTKNAVATSILSERWRALFPFAVPLIRLDLVDTHMFYTPSCHFMNFVDRLLNVDLRNRTCVKRVVFSCENSYGDDKIVSWVRVVLRLNVEHLRFRCFLMDSGAFFGSLNGCSTLVELELGSSFKLCLPREFVLPNLKRLSLNGLLFGDDMDSLQELLDGCPALNYLSLIDCDLGVSGTLYIRHPFIKTLFVDGNEGKCRVVIDAPNLEAFAFQGYFVPNYVLMNTKLLHSVCIDYENLRDKTNGNGWNSSSYGMGKLLKACSRTTRLRLPGDSAKALWFLSCVYAPTFWNLTSLALGRMGSHGWASIARFLKRAPNLTTLTFEEGLEFIWTSATRLLPNVPDCLEFYIKKIEIWEFKWRQDEINMIEYFLKNGRVLKELIVYCVPHENESNLEKLSTLPRHSKGCQVLIKDKSNLGISCYSRERWFQTRRA